MEEGERDPTLGGELLTVDGCLGRKSHDFWWAAHASVIGPIPVHTEATLIELCVFISKNTTNGDHTSLLLELYL